jgi:hypothetical protein
MTKRTVEAAATLRNRIHREIGELLDQLNDGFRLHDAAAQRRVRALPRAGGAGVKSPKRQWFHPDRLRACSCRRRHQRYF